MLGLRKLTYSFHNFNHNRFFSLNSDHWKDDYGQNTLDEMRKALIEIVMHSMLLCYANTSHVNDKVSQIKLWKCSFKIFLIN